MKRTRRARAKASQALKLRNSAKGKVPKSALGECFAGFGGSAFEAGLQTLPEIQQGKGKKTVEIVRDRFRTWQSNSRVWALRCVPLLLSAM